MKFLKQKFVRIILISVLAAGLSFLGVNPVLSTSIMNGVESVYDTATGLDQPLIIKDTANE